MLRIPIDPNTLNNVLVEDDGSGVGHFTCESVSRTVHDASPVPVDMPSPIASSRRVLSGSWCEDQVSESHIGAGFQSHDEADSNGGRRASGGV